MNIKLIVKVLMKNIPKNSSSLISQKCLDFIKLKDYQNIAAFYPLKNEVSLLELFSELHDLNITIALPSSRNKISNFLNWSKDELIIFTEKFPQPLSSTSTIIPDLIIVPLLCFDRKGQRIGYGSGFYDKTLPQYPNCIKVGVAFSKQEYCGYLPKESHDVLLDLVITEVEEIWIP